VLSLAAFQSNRLSRVTPTPQTPLNAAARDAGLYPRAGNRYQPRGPGAARASVEGLPSQYDAEVMSLHVANAPAQTPLNLQR
jgi:hypothetical protein